VILTTLCVACVPAVTTVSVNATLVNTGNVRLRNLAWTTSWISAASAWDLGCSLGPTGTETPVSSTAEVPVGEEMVCAGTFAVTQAVMEEGLSKALTASVSVKATDSLAAVPLPAGSVTTLSIPIQVTPNMTVDVLDTDCLKPYRAGAHGEGSSLLVVCAEVLPSLSSYSKQPSR
jgi:hypothetical protein